MAGADRGARQAAFSRWAWPHQGEISAHGAARLCGRCRSSQRSIDRLSSSCPPSPSLPDSMVPCTSRRPPPLGGHKRVFPTEFPAMVALEPQAAGHSSPAPIHDEFPFNPFVMTFETEGNETLALGFWAAIRKSAPILDFSTRRSRQCTADDARKTLTQRADYSQMTPKTRAKIRWIKQRSKQSWARWIRPDSNPEIRVASKSF